MDVETIPGTMDVETIPGGLKVCDANGQSLADVYSRENPNDAHKAKVLNEDVGDSYAKLQSPPTLNFCYPVGLNWGPFFVRRAGFGVADVDHAHVISQLRTFVRHSLSTVQSQTKPAVTAIPPTKNLSSDRSTNASYSTAAPARASATASAKAIVIRTND